MRVYYARPIFTPAERDYNSRIESMIDELGIERNKWGGKRDENDTRSRAKRVFDSCFAGIAPANAVLAILSGTEVDDGTACEIGIFYAMMEQDPTKLGIVGLLDDWRTNVTDEHLQGKGLNDLLAGCILRGGRLVHTPEDAFDQLKLWREEFDGKSVSPPAAGERLPQESIAPAAGIAAEEGPLTVYLAAPQYTPYARAYVAEHAQVLRDRGMEVYIPRQRVRIEPPLLTPEQVFDLDYAMLRHCQAMVILLDGAQPDDAAALELGLFYGLLRDNPHKKGIVGWMTDSRGLRRKEHGYGCNHFPVGVIEECGTLVDDFSELVHHLEGWNKAES